MILIIYYNKCATISLKKSLFSSENKEMKRTSGVASCHVLCCGRVSLLSIPLAGKGSLCRRPCGGSWDTSILRRSKQTTGTLGLPESFWASVTLKRQADKRLVKELHLIFRICSWTDVWLDHYHTPVVAVSWHPALLLRLIINLFIYISKRMI